MANQRLVNTNFWKDTYIIDLDPTQKLLFLYFLTNPRTSMAGVYEISLREVAFDTGIDRDMVEKILNKFCRDGKMYYGRGWLILRNFVKHQRMNPSIQKGIEKAVAELPAWLREVVENFSMIYDQQSLELADSPQSGSDWQQDEKDGPNKKSGPHGPGPTPAAQSAGITEVDDSLTPDSPQSEPIEAKLKEAKRNINKTITTHGASAASPTASTKSTQQPEKVDLITKLYYDVIKSLGLPVLNHNNVRKKIAAMKGELPEDELVEYQVFMREQFADLRIDFKPVINEALDIYGKRVAVRNAFERVAEEQQRTRVWKPRFT